MAADLAFVTAPDGRAAIVGPGVARCGPAHELVAKFAELEASGLAGSRVRWTWWSAVVDASGVVAAGVPVARCWDIAEAHRVLKGGWQADPQLCWATAHALSLDSLPAEVRGDLFDDFTRETDEVVRSDGYLEPAAGRPGWHPDDDALVAWGHAALECAERQAARLALVGPRALSLARSESAASFLCVELGRDGLPVDREAATVLIAASAGPRPRDESDAREIRSARDALVLRHVPGHERADLRNPAQVKEVLASVGVVVPNTRKWVLEPFRQTHPVVDALLEWRKAERIATTCGYTWLDTHVGPDDRLRGGWTACDGAAGRMTAQNGLHNLPTDLRSAVAAQPGYVFVRADLGQIEPRVLAVVSEDEAFAAATRADDLYAPVAARLGVERPVAKVAVLAAMYGQRSGAAGEALKGLERAYPVAMAYLDQAYAAGLRREPLRTFGGRLIRLDAVLADVPAEGAAAYDAARGRFARNAVIQGSAAELFKAWAATVRATTRDLGAQIVLCLHDELLVHVPEQHAQEVRRRLLVALDDSARRWSGTTKVRFVADASVIHRWSEAKE